MCLLKVMPCQNHSWEKPNLCNNGIHLSAAQREPFVEYCSFHKGTCLHSLRVIPSWLIWNSSFPHAHWSWSVLLILWIKCLLGVFNFSFTQILLVYIQQSHLQLCSFSFWGPGYCLGHSFSLSYTWTSNPLKVSNVTFCYYFCFILRTLNSSLTHKNHAQY